jgi:hypothetical protein
MVRVLGDLTGLSKSFTDTGKKAEGAASKAHAGFSTMLGALNKTGVLGGFGEALDGVQEAIGSIIENGKKIGPALAGAGAAIAGVGAGLTAVGSKDQAAHNQLQTSIEATGASYDDYEKQVEAAIKTQEGFGHTADQTQDALNALVLATHNPTEALKLLSTASDVAAAKHENLTQAATDVGKVYNGNTKLLKTFGISVAKTGDAQKGLTTATKAAQTADKNLAAAKQHLADLEAIDAGKKHLTTAEAINLRNAQQKVTDATAVAKGAHEKLATAQDAAKVSAGKQTDATTLLANVVKGQASASMDTFAGKLDVIKAKIEDQVSLFGQKYGPAITAVGTVAMAASGVVEVAAGIMSASWMATLGPIGLVILAIAGIGIAVYALIKYHNQVIAWLKQHWVIITDIVFGPFGLAFTLIATHFGAIVSAATGILRWFQSTWTTVTGYITAPFEDAWRVVSAGFDTLVRTVAGLPGRIAAVSAGMFHGMWEAFRSMVNGIIDLWNQLHFTLPKINEGPIHIGGETIGVPRIPHLAQGGLMTSSGIVFAHAGEVISPAPKAARSGPAVVLQGAVFQQPLDIDVFMRKAAWIAQTQRI